MQVEVTGLNAYGSASAASDPSDTIVFGAPVNTALPSVSGTPQRGQPLTASTGSWGPATVAYGYQWQRNEGSGFVSVPGATAATYTPSLTEEGDRFRIAVSATDGLGRTVANSASTTPVTAYPPTNTGAPTIAGTAQRTATLTMTGAGSWTGTGNTLSYRWQRSADGTTWMNIAGATAQTYVLAAGDDGDQVRLLVTAHNPDGSVSDASLPTSVVQALPPANTVAPSLSGTAQRSFTLTATQGAWTGLGNTYAYQWQRSADKLTWTSIAKATAVTYTLTAADENDYVRVLVTGINAAARVSQGSQPTTVVQSAPALNTAAPTITGTAQRTARLTMTSAGTWTGIGNTYTYQWQRSADGTTWTSIAKATARTYTLTAADDGDRVRILVTAANPDGSVGQGSLPTTTVQSAPALNTVAPTVTGTARRGSKLTATQGTWTGIGNTYADQWQRSPDGTTWTSIAKATARTYTLTAADEGDEVRMLVTGTNPAGSVSAGSRPTTAVQSAPAVNTVVPTVSGTARSAAKLTATPGTWTGVGNTYTYQWQRSADGTTWTGIAAATTRTETLTAADAGESVRILVTATNADGAVAAPS